MQPGNCCSDVCSLSFWVGPFQVPWFPMSLQWGSQTIVTLHPFQLQQQNSWSVGVYVCPWLAPGTMHLQAPWPDSLALT